jgi:hypothetical protein
VRGTLRFVTIVPPEPVQIFIAAGEAKLIVAIAGKNESALWLEPYLSDPVPPLSDSIPFVSDYPELRGEGITAYGSNKPDLPPLPVPNFNVNAMIDALNIPGMAETASRSFFEKGRARSVTFIRQDTGLGLCSLFRPGPVSDATLAWADETAEGFAAFHAALNDFPQVIRSVIAASENPGLPAMYEGILSQAEMMTGIHPEKGLFELLGDEMILLMYPSGTGGGFPLFSLLGLNGMALAVKLNDQTAFTATSQTIAALLSKAASMDRLDGGLRTLEHEGISIMYIKAGAGLLSPCYALKDGYLLFTMNVPLMKHLLGARDRSSLADTAEYRRTLEECGGETGSVVTFEKSVEGSPFMRDLGNSIVSLGAAAVIGGLLHPRLGTARTMAKRAQCMNNIRQIGHALMMYAMDRDEKFPDSLDELTGFYLDRKALQCPEAPDPALSYHYLPGLSTNAPWDAIIAFDRKGNHENGRNVLFSDVHVEFLDENEFRETLRGMLEQEYSSQYSPEAVELIRAILAGDELVPDPVETVPSEFANILDEEKVLSFIVREGRSIASKVDFALFPRGDVFPGGGKSNFSVLQVKEDGFYTKRYTGHVLGSGAGTAAVLVGLTAVVAAIAVPNVIRARRRAGAMREEMLMEREMMEAEKEAPFTEEANPFE